MISLMSKITRNLSQMESGIPQTADELLPMVYDELRRLAAAKLNCERDGISFDATALVHEAYMRLVGSDKAQNWDTHGHFFAAAAEAMRRVLLNHARDKARLKRGGDRRRLDFSKVTAAINAPDEALIELDEAISLLAAKDSVAADLVKLRFFVGLPLKDASFALGLTRRQGDRLWAYARAWLFDWLRKD